MVTRSWWREKVLRTRHLSFTCFSWCCTQSSFSFRKASISSATCAAADASNALVLISFLTLLVGCCCCFCLCQTLCLGYSFCFGSSWLRLPCCRLRSINRQIVLLFSIPSPSAGTTYNVQSYIFQVLSTRGSVEAFGSQTPSPFILRWGRIVLKESRSRLRGIVSERQAQDNNNSLRNNK